MKTLSKLFCASLLLSGIFCLAQVKDNPLAGTEWKGVASIPDPAEVTFKFHNTDVDLVYLGMVIEKMAYSFTDQGSLILKKIEGRSPCSPGDEGIYKYQIAADTLTFTSVDDKCEERETAFDGNGYKKVVAN